jgi:hypothetical protein
LKRTAGKWNPEGENRYFIASSPGVIEPAVEIHRDVLIALNEMNDSSLDNLERWSSEGTDIFLDSGVFNLTNEHARKHDVTMDVALALPPDEIEGFDKLFSRYCAVMGRLEGSCWGYIEIDQGGRENKIKTRARLEAMGLRPIPVYHPFNDGWDYFDELAENYDRICFGNLVQADQTTRKRFLATAWERRRRYPELWIHLLGMTPNEWLNAFPVNSCDSSSWLVGLRWAAAHREEVALKTWGEMPEGFRYELGSKPDSPRGREKATRLAAYQARLLGQNWRSMLAEYRQLGFNHEAYQ